MNKNPPILDIAPYLSAMSYHPEFAEVLSDASEGSGPFDGGCLICANALKLVFGRGNLIRVASKPDGGRPEQAEHYGVLIDGEIIDMNGVHDDEEAWIQTLLEEGMPVNRRYRIALGWDSEGDIPHNGEAEQRLAEIIRQEAAQHRQELAEVAKLAGTGMEKEDREEAALLQDAYQFARRAHAGQTRLSMPGEAPRPYIEHPLMVARILREAMNGSHAIHPLPEKLDFSLDMLRAALLHDTLEDCEIEAEGLAEQFGDDVAHLVQELTNPQDFGPQGKKSWQAEHLRHASFEVCCIKIADKTANLIDLRYNPPDWPTGRKMKYFLDAEAIVLAACNNWTAGQKMNAEALMNSFQEAFGGGMHDLHRELDKVAFAEVHRSRPT